MGDALEEKIVWREGRYGAVKNGGECEGLAGRRSFLCAESSGVCSKGGGAQKSRTSQGTVCLRKEKGIDGYKNARGTACRSKRKTDYSVGKEGYSKRAARDDGKRQRTICSSYFDAMQIRSKKKRAGSGRAKSWAFLLPKARDFSPRYPLGVHPT